MVKQTKKISSKEDKNATSENLSIPKLNVGEIAKKFSNFEELRTEYELIEDHLTTKTILRKMAETLEGYIKIVIQILQPEEFPSLYECAVFDDAEKTKIFVLFKDLMIAHREILKAEVINEEKNNITTINYVHQEIKNHKPEIVSMVTKMQDSWKKDNKQSKARYFG
jgi:hypothetical protein